MNAFEKILDRIPSRKRITADRYLCNCPAHPDNSPSLTVSYNPDTGKVLMKCHTGCSSLDIVHSLGLELKDLFDHHAKDFIPASTSRNERWNAKLENHKIEEAIGYLAVVEAALAAGKKLTVKEAERASVYREKLRKMNMEGIEPYWRR